MGQLGTLLILAVLSFLAVVCLVPLVRRVALSYGVIDAPLATKLHSTPIPYLGGVAIALAAAIASAFVPHWSVEGGVIVLGALLVATVGLVDDIRNLNPAPRLVAEVVAASLAASAGARVHLFGGGLDVALTVFWLVVITNAFNLLDNMDGAAGVIATTISFALIVAAGLEGQWLVGGLAAVVGGCCLGFLVFNRHPARIFMGDAGSLFVGFLLAAIALKLRFVVGQPSGSIAVALLMGPAVFDTTLVVVARIRGGRSVLVGGTDHTSHRLLRLGLTTNRALALLAAGSVGSAAAGVAVGRGVLSAAVVVPPLAIAGIVALIGLLRVPTGIDDRADAERLVGSDPEFLGIAVAES